MDIDLKNRLDDLARTQTEQGERIGQLEASTAELQQSSHAGSKRFAEFRQEVRAGNEAIRSEVAELRAAISDPETGVVAILRDDVRHARDAALAGNRRSVVVGIVGVLLVLLGVAVGAAIVGGENVIADLVPFFKMGVGQ